MAETEKRWKASQGVAGIETLLRTMRTSFRRGLYNQVSRLETQLSQIKVPSSVDQYRVYNIVLALTRIKQGADAVGGSIGDIKLMQDEDVMKQAADRFKALSITKDFIEADLGRLHISWHGATYDIGHMKIRYYPRINMASRKLTVFNMDRPGEARYPHPHVNSDGYVCWGTWKSMIEGLLEDRWNWLRCLVLTAKFLEHYTPEGTPYQRLGQGWTGRFVSGSKLCENCDRGASTCVCIRPTELRSTCPKTEEVVRGRLPVLDYCTGCSYLGSGSGTADLRCNFFQEPEQDAEETVYTVTREAGSSQPRRYVGAQAGVYEGDTMVRFINIEFRGTVLARWHRLAECRYITTTDGHIIASTQGLSSEEIQELCVALLPSLGPRQDYVPEREVLVYVTESDSAERVVAVSRQAFEQRSEGSGPSLEDLRPRQVAVGPSHPDYSPLTPNLPDALLRLVSGVVRIDRLDSSTMLIKAPQGGWSSAQEVREAGTASR